jgi:predicted kinase
VARPTLILVTGPPGSGKTTLAHQVAAAVGCPAICRDEIKEGMVAASPGFVPEVDDPLTRRTYGLFFDLLRLLLAAEVTTVAEAAFQHRLWQQGLQPLAGLADLRLIRCRISAGEAQRRIRARLADANRGAHADLSVLLSLDDSGAGPASDFVELDADAPTLDVDTSDGYRPGLPTVFAFARAEPPGASPAE